jgi:RecA-family ATPase
MEPIARQLLGEPNSELSTKTNPRWGSNGSMSVDLEKGVFFNNEEKVGGGVLDLIEHQVPCDRAGAWDWLHANYPETKPKPNGHDAGGAQIVKTYDYVDADGTLLSQVCRKQPKAFTQRRPDPSAEGGWVWSTKGVKSVPYRLPELLDDIADARPIFIVEGEKDADRLRAAGLAATTNAGGAGNWKPALNPHFKGADVVVIADNDPQSKGKDGQPLWHTDGRPQLPGQDHAATVAKALAPVAWRVRLLDLGQAWRGCPPKGDASDFLGAGHTVAELEALAAELPPYGAPTRALVGFTIASLEGLPVPPRVWHVHQLVPARTVTLLGGDGGVGKSILALQLAFATAAGLAWIGQQVRQGRALHLSAEDDRDELHRRSDQISTFYGTPLKDVPGLTLWSLADDDALLVTGGPGQPLQATARWEELKRFIALDRPALVVLDSLADVYGANENERSQVRQFVRMLRGLAMPADTAVLLLGHPSLTGLATGSGLSGSTGWNNSVRSRMFMSAPVVEDGGASQPNLRTLAVKKANYAQAGAELQLRYVAGAFDCDELSGPTMSGLDRQIAADRVDALFLQLLDAFTIEGRFVSHNSGHAYAPALMAADPRAHGATSKAFATAMNRQFAAGVIRVATRGPQSRQISFLQRVKP